jgi:hypothetical protein
MLLTNTPLRCFKTASAGLTRYFVLIAAAFPVTIWAAMMQKVVFFLTGHLIWGVAPIQRCLISLLLWPALSIQLTGQEAVTASQTREIAAQAYTFAYPLVLVELTRRAGTLDRTPRFINHFAHAPAFPDDHFRQVVRPNADTLYSTSWLDLSKEPVLLHVPDTEGRYYVMQLMDAWTETIGAPGKRTTGTSEGWFAVVGPGWQGRLPEHVRRIDSPTNTVWLLGRTQTNGSIDYGHVHSIQQGYILTPLSSFPQGQAPLTMADFSMLQARMGTSPLTQMERLSTAEFFQLVAQLLVANPPHAADQPIMRQLARIGVVAGKPFPAEKLSPDQLKAVDEGMQAAAKALAVIDPKTRPVGKTGWTLPGHYGRYGTDYPARALTARLLLGPLPAEDAIYLGCWRDAGGDALDGGRRYTMHFAKGEIPPAQAFWSLSLYDAQGYFASNPLKRFAIGDRDQLKFNADGSLDFYIQHDSPGNDKESNWLPAPPGAFSLALRIYWPEDQVISGAWAPPAVVVTK